MSLANTQWEPHEIGAALLGKKILWFIGIGGIHMSSLALLSRERGFTVRGSDCAENENTRRLEGAGISVCRGHDPSALADADAVVYTLAISEDNPEYLEARRRGLHLFSRADYLGYLMSDFPSRIGIAGSHGKSTVTAMLGEILDVAGRAPNIVCGADMPHFGAPFAAGGGKDFLFEACEYGNSFLRFSPTLAVVLNAELDHVDFFKDEASLITSFSRFIQKADAAVLPKECAALRRAAQGRPAVTFGLGTNADYRAQNLSLEGGTAQFDLYFPKGCVGRVSLAVPGEHNVKNALAAAAAADLLGVRPSDITAALSHFSGIARRFQYRGRLNGARVFDDYAHHPTEIKTALHTARSLCKGGRLFAVFQSHTFSRTKAFFEDICAALSGADRVLIADIYAAREKDPLGMSAKALADGIGRTASVGGDFAAMAKVLQRELTEKDLLLVMGAGDVDRIFGEFSKKHFTL
ncbi:MAG: UDP-N-acetylmuramate--L-alanine ligase [Clostridia bacterium]|nr:UDP-N-acetylmuramate--L-alanine ligase [Clostridia bacterium]